jgi:outer membrane lipoprotein-sorting protein
MNERLHIIAGATLLVLLLGPAGSEGGKGLTPAQILKKADKAGYAKSSHMIIEQTIRTTGGDKRTFTIESWSKNGNEKSLMRFLSPAPSKGIGMLALEHGDNIWAYFPDSDDLRKIASSARNSSMEGSDFSYEDMTMGETGRRYEAVSATKEDLDGTPCWKVTLEPKKSSPYRRIVSWVDRDSFVVHRSHFFSKKDKHVKTLTLSGWKKVKGVWTPYKMVMKNLERGSKTSIKVLKLKFNLELDDSKFTTEFLTLI